MDFETFFQSLLTMLKSGENAYFVTYAVATCLLTQGVKKLFVNKVKSEIANKFNVAVILPFAFGAAFAVVDACLISPADRFTADVIWTVAVNAATIGALATVMFKLCSSLSGQNMKSLLKDDVFGIFYTQLLYFGNARKQLLSKELSLKDFLAQVKLVAANSKKIYCEQEEPSAKKEKLARLLRGVVDDDSLNACLDVLHEALICACASERAEKTDK